LGLFGKTWSHTSKERGAFASRRVVKRSISGSCVPYLLLGIFILVGDGGTELLTLRTAMTQKRGLADGGVLYNSKGVATLRGGEGE